MPYIISNNTISTEYSLAKFQSCITKNSADNILNWKHSCIMIFKCNIDFSRVPISETSFSRRAYSIIIISNQTQQHSTQQKSRKGQDRGVQESYRPQSSADDLRPEGNRSEHRRCVASRRSWLASVHANLRGSDRFAMENRGSSEEPSSSLAPDASRTHPTFT